MEVFAILSSCVALIAITLIFNLFVNLRNTDKAVQNEVKQTEIVKTEKNTDKKKEESKKAEPKAKKNKIRPNDFKHQTLLTNLKETVWAISNLRVDALPESTQLKIAITLCGSNLKTR